jgi:hypothetical protein
MLGSTIAAQLTPTLGNLIELTRTDVRRGGHHFGEVIEVSTPIAVADGQEEVFFCREVFVDSAFGVPGGASDVIERCRDKPFFAEDFLGGVDQK